MIRDRISKRLRALSDPADLDEEPDQDDLIPWRRRIDQVDQMLLELLNERARCANIIGRLKKKTGLPVYVPQREEKVLEQVRNANEGPLPDTAVRNLFERIIDETRSLERKKYQDDSKT